jgi:hypothetical protein
VKQRESLRQLAANNPSMLRALAAAHPQLRAQLVAAGAAGEPESQVAGQTVMEAQQGGELVQLQDDASYALDGLAASSSLATQRDSAVTLCEMLATRKGRLALK